MSGSSVLRQRFPAAFRLVPKEAYSAYVIHELETGTTPLNPHATSLEQDSCEPAPKMRRCIHEWSDLVHPRAKGWPNHRASHYTVDNVPTIIGRYQDGTSIATLAYSGPPAAIA